ncbi:hypothetical protein SH1V18_24050 [Vallitalea longa]|uniref:Uncharacterized protein n=1 Tax=Vallitalea longa TaxID=2936439 RepID=A0A9W6DEV6_9FIRM|nr:hypothetical protein [Vallitalea longa]GKX29925.1 hypothetical protein SH1V18_24050 [Vallitalea longa]
MKYWNEIQKDAFSYFGFFSKEKARLLINTIPNLSVFSINGLLTSGGKVFLEKCAYDISQIFQRNDLSKLKFYLFVNIELDDNSSRIEKYKKVWKLLQPKWQLDEFIKGPEVEIKLGEKIFYSSVAQFSVNNFLTALEIVASNPQRNTIIATNKNDMLTEKLITHLFNLSFYSSLGSDYSKIDYFNLSLNRGIEDIIFRWGNSSEEAELALIFNENMFNIFQSLF